MARDGLAEAVRTVTANAAKAVPGAKIDGVLVSEMAQGVEALIGVINDESFGPVVALGLGGVLTEVLKDVTYRIAPFDLETAREMIAELRGAKLFDGYRGQPAADKEALARTLVAASQMAAALAPRLKELDINPVFVGPSRRGGGRRAGGAEVKVSGVQGSGFRETSGTLFRYPLNLIPGP